LTKFISAVVKDTFYLLGTDNSRGQKTSGKEGTNPFDALRPDIFK
jgi:hypothetical protein